MAQHIARYKSKAAVHALGEKAEGMLEPLLEKDENSIASRSSDESSEYSAESSVWSIKVKPSATEIMKTAAVSIVLLVGAAASAGAIILSPAVAVFVMAGVSLVHAPYAAYKEVRIIKLPALRSLNNRLKQEANKLEGEVDILAAEIDLLQPEAERAAEAEEELRLIADEQHYNVDKLVDLVNENESILDEMRDNLRNRIVQDIFKIVISSDKNNDGRFCRVETKMLVLKISLQLQEYGVEFDESKFYKVMSVDPTVAQTLEIVKRLVPQLNDDSGMGEDGSNGTGGDDEDEDLYDMFHMAAGSSIQGSLTSTTPSLSTAQRRMSLAIKPQTRKSTESVGEEKQEGHEPGERGESTTPSGGRTSRIRDRIFKRDEREPGTRRRDKLAKKLNTPVSTLLDL